MTTPPNRHGLDTADLWRSVDRLTKDRTQRLIRELDGTKRVEHVKVPSLWTQLLEALASTSSGDSDRPGKSIASRSPLDLSIVALLTEMSTVLRAGLAELGHRPRVLIAPPTTGPGRSAPELGRDENGVPLLDPDMAGRLTEAAARSHVRTDTSRLRHDVLSDLRQYAAAIVSTNDQAAVDKCARHYAEWVWRAETMLTADDESVDMRGIRGHACPHCAASFVERVEPSLDPRAVDGVERFRDAALVVAFRDGQVQHVTCRACSAGWWRGDDVERLGAGIRAASPSPTGPVSDRPTYGDNPNHGSRLSGRADDWWPWHDPRRTA